MKLVFLAAFALLMVAAIIFFAFTNKNNAGAEAIPFPKNPQKISIEVHQGGGMQPEGESLLISNDSCVWERWELQKTQRIEFVASHSELLQLYQVFIDNQFNKIETYTEEIHDRGGSSIRLNADDKYFDVSNSGMTLLKERWYPAYKKVLEAIWEFAKKKTNDQLKTYTIALDPSLWKDNSSLVFSIKNVENNLYNESEEGRKEQFVFRAFPYEYELNSHYKTNTPVAQYLHYSNFQLILPPKDARMRLFWAKDSLRYELLD